MCIRVDRDDYLPKKIKPFNRKHCPVRINNSVELHQNQKMSMIYLVLHCNQALENKKDPL